MKDLPVSATPQKNEPPNLANFLTDKEQSKDGWRSFKFYRDPKPPKLILWIVRKSGRLIATPQQASHMLIGMTILLVSLAFLLAAYASLKYSKVANLSDELIHRPQPKTSLLPQKPRMRPRYKTVPSQVPIPSPR